MYAMKAYDKPSCKTLIEFENDVARFTNLVRLAAKNMGQIEIHILLNNILILLNIFKQEECIEMMFFKVKKNDWFKIKTILVYLNRMPNYIQCVGVNSSEIETCEEMLEILSKI